MRPPYRADLVAAKDGESWSYASGLHPSPRLYKHYWRVFTLDSELEGWDFLQNGPVLCTAQCAALTDQLTLEKKPFIVYGWKRPRKYPGMPFSPSSKRWRDTEWAPDFDLDTDPLWDGYK